MSSDDFRAIVAILLFIAVLGACSRQHMTVEIVFPKEKIEVKADKPLLERGQALPFTRPYEKEATK